MTKEQPLCVRLYFSPLLIALARMIGYSGVSLDDARVLADPLGKQYGKEKVQAAAHEISRVEDNKWMWLTDEARKACWQLLGPPPEHPDYKPPVPEEKPPEAALPEPAKKRRKRKAS